MFSLASCVGKPPDSAHLAGLKRVSVISALGEELRLQETATLIFGNTLNSGNIADWKLDAFIADEMAHALAGRYDVRKVNYSASDFRSKAGGAELGAAVREHVKAEDGQSLDAYLVVVPTTRQDSVFGTTAQLTGLTLYRRGAFGMHNDAVVTVAKVVVIDGHDFHQIGWTWLLAGESLGDSLVRASWLSPGRYFRVVPGELWSEKFEGLTQDQKDKLRGEFVALLKDEIPHTVQTLKLSE